MRGKHRARVARKRSTENSDYAAMLIRMIYGYGKRVGDDPAALAHLRDIEAALRDAVNLGIAWANKETDRPYSINEMAAILGVSKQAVHKRVQNGGEVLDRIESAQPVVRLQDMRDARAAALRAAGVEDRTGSQREIEAG